MPISAICALTIFTANASLLLGGGTRAGHLSDALLQFLSLPLLLTGLWRWLEQPPRLRPRFVAPLCLGLVALPLLQLAPLPPAIWTALPGRDVVVESLRLIGVQPGFAPMSVAPFSTQLALLSLVPPLAVFFGALSLSCVERRIAFLSLLPLGALSVLLGLVQVAQGPASAARFYPITNTIEAVGFFANRNHFGALLYCLILVAATWVSDAASAGVRQRGSRGKLSAGRLAAIVCGVTLIAMLLSGEALCRSRAGALLAVAALGGAYLVNRADARRATAGLSAQKLVVGAVLLSGALSLEVFLNRLLTRLVADPMEDYRWTIANHSLAAAKAFFPVGSGFGTFVDAYALFESAQDSLENAYVNRAHDDFLEAVVEGGVFSVALILAFIAWWFVATRRAWRPLQRDEPHANASFRRAATLVVLLLLAHSLVDYPLRTSAMTAVFALACALMLEAPAAATAAAGNAEGDASASPAGRRRPTRTRGGATS